jgi:hypothetical protein
MDPESIKFGDRASPFILGLINEGYTESSFENRNHKLKGQINGNLAKLNKLLPTLGPLWNMAFVSGSHYFRKFFI